MSTVPASAPAPAPAHPALTPLQTLIKETLDIPDHLTSNFNKGDIRMAYSRFLAIADARKKLSKLSTDGIWTQKLPTLQDVAGLFASKSTYFNHNQIFAQVHNFPLVEKWLLNEDDAPSDSVLWGSKKPTYQKLKQLVKPEGKKKKEKKGKKRQDTSSSEQSPERMKDKKGKGKKGEDNGKKGSSSKSRYM